MRTAIVTASDEGYFPLLLDLLTTLHQHPATKDLPVSVLDVGLSAQQSQALSSQVAQVIAPGWDIHFPTQDAVPRWFRAMVSRPFLPKYVPDAEMILWIDADCWLQDGRGVELLVEGAKDGQLAIVPELHPAYAYLYGKGNVRKILYDTALAGWGMDVVKMLLNRPILNSGFFALRREARHWGAWTDTLREGLARNNGKMFEQTALNLAVYALDLPIHPLPAWCNWISVHADPAYDAANRWLTEPNLPCQKLSLVHITTLRNRLAKIRTTDGQTVEMDISYSGFSRFLQKQAGSG